MATDKRERQRANREAKRAVEQKLERRQKLFERGKRIALWAVVFIVLVVITNLIIG